MNEDTLILIVLTLYLVGGYFISKYVSKALLNKNRIFRLTILSLLYAVFFGIGIASSGGNHGIGFPAPNGIALYMMAKIDNTEGLLNGIFNLTIWWMVIFLVMNVRLKKKLQFEKLKED